MRRGCLQPPAAEDYGAFSCLFHPARRLASFTAVRERLEDVRIVSAGIISLAKLSLCTLLVINVLAGAWHYIGRHSASSSDTWMKHYCPYVGIRLTALPSHGVGCCSAKIEPACLCRWSCEQIHERSFVHQRPAPAAAIHRVRVLHGYIHDQYRVRRHMLCEVLCLGCCTVGIPTDV